MKLTKERIQDALNQIKQYESKKNNDMFDDFYMTHLNIFEYGLRVFSKLSELRELVDNEDIPSPTVPEYIEHHESIQKILKFIDSMLDKEV
jgi:hypothetical protein